MNKKVAIITGANRGIGHEISQELGKMGFKIILGIRDPDMGRMTEERLVSTGIDAKFYQLDVSNPQSIQKFCRDLSHNFSKIDVLINNAGIFIDEEDKDTILTTSIDIISRTFTTNVLGPIQLIQGIVPLMQGEGQIINMSSGMGQLESMQGGSPAYRIAKTALNAVTKITAADLAATAIKVNAVCPGWVRTDMGGVNATRSVAEGAATPVFLATQPHQFNGKFLRDKEVIPW